MKECTFCHKIKSFDCFSIDTRVKTGTTARCKDCLNYVWRQKYKDNPEPHKNRNKIYGQKNLKKIRKQKNEYRAKNVEQHREYQRKYYRKHKNKILERANIRENTPLRRFKRNLRNRIRKALNGTSKSKKTFDLLGCSITTFRNYLESLFQPGMTWKNYGHGRGKWVMDHIKCLDSFDLSRPEEQYIAFHYTNIQPLWFEENSSKNNKSVEEWESYKQKINI